jgi:hypothetical protein
MSPAAGPAGSPGPGDGRVDLEDSLDQEFVSHGGRVYHVSWVPKGLPLWVPMLFLIDLLLVPIACWIIPEPKGYYAIVRRSNRTRIGVYLVHAEWCASRSTWRENGRTSKIDCTVRVRFRSTATSVRLAEAKLVDASHHSTPVLSTCCPSESLRAFSADRRAFEIVRGRQPPCGRLSATRADMWTPTAPRPPRAAGLASRVRLRPPAGGVVDAAGSVMGGPT